LVEAYAPFGSGSLNLLNDVTLSEIATEVNKSVGQVVLRWIIQQGCCVLPKSSSEKRMIENLSVFDFELSNDHMSKIDKLGVYNKRTCPNPDDVL
jgi:2,5-diketo-D-gluconate reductase A